MAAVEPRLEQVSGWKRAAAAEYCREFLAVIGSILWHFIEASSSTAGGVAHTFLNVKLQPPCYYFRGIPRLAAATRSLHCLLASTETSYAHLSISSGSASCSPGFSAGSSAWTRALN